MGRAPRLPVDGLTYHVTARGNNRQPIFNTELDRTSFLALVEETRARRGWRIPAWCLMTNHIHLLITTETFDVSAGLRDILGRYARRYNHFHERTGHLFGHRFHSVPVTSDEQFFATVRYVNRNPVRASIVDDPAHYPWSSYAQRGTLRPPITVDETTILKRLHPVPSMAERQFHQLIRSDPAPGRAGSAAPELSTLVQLLGEAEGAQAAVNLGYGQREVATAIGITESCLSRRLNRTVITTRAQRGTRRPRSRSATTAAHRNTLNGGPSPAPGCPTPPDTRVGSTG